MSQTRNRTRWVVLPLALVATGVSCGGRGAKAPLLGVALGVDAEALDASVSPCEDFYGYACGGWLKSSPLRDDEPRRIRSFSLVQDRNEALLRQLLERYAEGGGVGEPYARPLGDFYASCMDLAGIERGGLAAADPHLAMAAAVKDGSSFSRAAGILATFGIWAPFSVSVEPDMQDATRTMLYLEQGGLSLPDRDVYVGREEHQVKVLAEYFNHVTRMFQLLGDEETAARRSATAVVRLETALAEATRRPDEMRDPRSLYHPTRREELAATMGSFDVNAYLAAAGFEGVSVVNVTNPALARAIGVAIGNARGDELSAYLRWHVLRRFAPFLPKAFADEAFRMRSILTGVPKRPERFRECLAIVVDNMSHAVGQSFVRATFGAEGKAKAKAMLGSLKEAMEKNLASLLWMDSATRERALAKLREVDGLIAYPDAWRSYDGLVVDRNSLLGNELRATRFDYERMRAKLGQPVDRADWFVPPTLVDAFYSAERNQMVFPAGILQPPLFDEGRSAAANFGAIGAIMGHELTHGFDDEGRRFDAKGNLRDWWSPAAHAEFERRASCLAAQYSSYVAVGKETVNGELTLGENIADLGGVKLAYAALKARGGLGAPAAPGGLSPAAQFFVAFAQTWCSAERDAASRLLLKTDPHAPPRFRVVGVVSNMPEFAEAFACKRGDAMVRPPEARCEVW